METPNLHLIKVTYLPVTQTLGVRLKITSLRFNHSVVIPRDDYKYKSYTKQVVSFLESKGFNILGKSINPDFDYFITDTFEPLK